MEIFYARGAEGAPAIPDFSEQEAFSRPHLGMLYDLADAFGNAIGVADGETRDEFIARIQSGHEAEKALRTPEQQTEVDKYYDAEADRLRTLPDTSACELR